VSRGKGLLWERDALVIAAEAVITKAEEAGLEPSYDVYAAKHPSPAHRTAAKLLSIGIQLPFVEAQELADAKTSLEDLQDELNERDRAIARLEEQLATERASKVVDLSPSAIEAVAKARSTTKLEAIGTDAETGHTVAALPDGRITHISPRNLIVNPRRIGKMTALAQDMLVAGGYVSGKSEQQIRRETLAKVIEALELDAYAPSDPVAFFSYESSTPGVDRFWADIETTLADRADDAEMDRIEAARARIEGIRRPVTPSTDDFIQQAPSEFDLAGETLGDAA